MNDSIRQAFASDRVIDITTMGKSSGEPRRKEIWFHNLGGHLYITGTPGKRDWYANLVAHPEFTFHLKQSVQTDLVARATPITDANERRAILSQILAKLERNDNIEDWIARSPLVAVAIEGY